MIQLPSYGDVNVRILEKLLDAENTTTSYKLFWFKALLNQVKLGKRKMSFEELVYDMVVEAWHITQVFRLHLGAMDQLAKKIRSLCEKYSIAANLPYNQLLRQLHDLPATEIKSLVQELTKYVPYRLLSPFYRQQLKGIKDNEKNGKIVLLTEQDSHALYRFLSDQRGIEIHPLWFEYLERNQAIISGWYNYKLVLFLQRGNPNVPNIASKLMLPSQRDLTRARKYWSEVLKVNPLHDIYTGEVLSAENFAQKGELSIDHFVPWSFVMHDQLWNLTPTFSTFNSAKSDSLPPLDKYLQPFCDLHYDALTVMGEQRYRKKVLEDYLVIDAAILQQLPSREKFLKAMQDTIQPLYQIAYNQGFEIWEN